MPLLVAGEDTMKRHIVSEMHSVSVTYWLLADIVYLLSVFVSVNRLPSSNAHVNLILLKLIMIYIVNAVKCSLQQISK